MTEFTVEKYYEILTYCKQILYNKNKYENYKYNPSDEYKSNYKKIKVNNLKYKNFINCDKYIKNNEIIVDEITSYQLFHRVDTEYYLSNDDITINILYLADYIVLNNISINDVFVLSAFNAFDYGLNKLCIILYNLIYIWLQIGIESSSKEFMYKKIITAYAITLYTIIIKRYGINTTSQIEEITAYLVSILDGPSVPLLSETTKELIEKYKNL